MCEGASLEHIHCIRDRLFGLTLDLREWLKKEWFSRIRVSAVCTMCGWSLPVKPVGVNIPRAMTPKQLKITHARPWREHCRILRVGLSKQLKIPPSIIMDNSSRSWSYQRLEGIQRRNGKNLLTENDFRFLLRISG